MIEKIHNKWALVPTKYNKHGRINKSRTSILKPKKIILVKAVPIQSVQSISPLALPVSQFLLAIDSVNELYLDILQSMMFPPRRNAYRWDHPEPAERDLSFRDAYCDFYDY